MKVDAVRIRLHDDFPGSMRSEPGASTWVRPGGVCHWPLSEFQAHMGRVGEGQWSVVSNGAPTADPTPEPPARSDDEDRAIPAWLSDYPAGDWRDIVKVAKSLGFEGKKKDDAVAFLCDGEGGPIWLDLFNSILSGLEA